MTFAEWDAMPPAERALRIDEWLACRHAEAEAASDREQAIADEMTRRELDRGFARGMGGET